jgi:hypothetical protein
MNKQQKTYGLLLAVLLIWGIIGYQIYKRLNPASPELSTTALNTDFERQQAVATSFYEVHPEYRDPFLGKYPQKKRHKAVKKKIVLPKITAPFPNVMYNGVIEGNESQLYILTINGRQEIVKLGQEIQKIKLISADTKQAIVKFEGVRKTVFSKQ